MTITINREAGDKAKGFRLQKLRAAKLMLEANETKKVSFFYAAIEVLEDVAIIVVSDDETKISLEEDKNYDSSKNFTIFSTAVKNTLVSFFDIYIQKWKESESINLGFYTTASIGKESKKVLDDGTAITLPSTPILELLQSVDVMSDQELSTVHSVLIEEYQKQYSSKVNKGNLETLEKYSLDKFKNFLKRITWCFGQEDELNLKKSILDAIKNSKLYNYKVANKEETILSLILEKLEERQTSPDYFERFLHSAEIELIFKQAESEEVDKVCDPVWSHVKTLESEITDKRNLEEKVLSVCPEYDLKLIKLLARQACISKTEQSNNNKTFLSMKYRIYIACEEYFMKNGKQVKSSPVELNQIIADLKTNATSSIEELKKSYFYTTSHQQALDGVVMDLIDTCFIAFDEK